MRDFEYQMIPETQGQPSEVTLPAKEINRFAEMNPLCSEYNVFAEDQRAAEFGREQQPSRSSQSSAGRAQQNSGRNASSAGRAQRTALRRSMKTGLQGFKMMGMTLTAVAVVSKQHSFSLSDHTCADCAYIAPVYVWFADNMLPTIYYSDAADPNSWYINAALLAINVDTTRVADVDLEIIPGEGWENRAAPSVNKGSLGNGGTTSGASCWRRSKTTLM